MHDSPLQHYKHSQEQVQQLQAQANNFKLQPPSDTTYELFATQPEMRGESTIALLNFTKPSVVYLL
jgi:hypothetical protein